MKDTKTKKIALLGLMVTLSLILSYVESLISLPLRVPGIKLGIANLVILFLLYTFGEREALLVNVVRILLAALLFGNAQSLMFSLSGAALSFLVMAAWKRVPFSSVVSAGILGGVFHNLGQLLAACFLFSTVSLRYYLPVLIPAGLICGLLTGGLAKLLIERLPRQLYADEERE